MSRAWYYYTRSGHPCLPENYIYSPAKPTCNSGRIVCAVYALYCGINPCLISTNLCTYIAILQATGLAQPSQPVGAKKYVYGLPS